MPSLLKVSSNKTICNFVSVASITAFVLSKERIRTENFLSIVFNFCLVTLAVLPFQNFSTDQEQDYFVDGLTEALSNKLAQVNDLQVVGRTSSYYFKDKNIDIREIGEMLGAAYLLEGSVQKSEDQIRITAQLNEAANGLAGDW